MVLIVTESNVDLTARIEQVKNAVVFWEKEVQKLAQKKTGSIPIFYGRLARIKHREALEKELQLKELI